MRIAALYDIHGNLPALEAVLDDALARRVDRIVVGGDVLPGPFPRECLDLLRAQPLPVDYIIGNGDREVAATRDGAMSTAIPAAFRAVMLWNARQLTDQDVNAIRSWPLTARLRTPIGEVLFCHATPRSDVEVFTASTAETKLRPIFDALDSAAVVCGHTHMQFDRRVGNTRVINAGSVGMPFQAAAAYWLLIDERMELCRTDYDLEGAAERVRSTRYPQADEFAATNILNPPSEAAMLAAFANAELT